jgi:glycosyltransferase involved in cell wall biosynthesis
MRNTRDGRPVVAVVGPAPSSRGGIASTVGTHLASPLRERFRFIGIATHTEGRAPAKLWRAVAGLTRLAWVAPWVDLVHVHTSIGGSLLRKTAALTIARAFGKPVVLHVHAGKVLSAHERSRMTRAALRFAFRHAAAIVTLTPGWARALVENAGAPADRVYVVGNVPDLPAVLDRDPEPLVLYLGHLYRSKGVYDLLEAFAEIHKTMPDTRLVLAGQGRERDELRSLVDAVGLDGAVELPGWVDAGEKAALLARAACLVLPSHAEGLPLTVLEAMTAGTPVVATAVGGMPEMIESGLEGVLVPSEDPEALAEGIRRLLTEPAYAEMIAGRARERARAQFSPGAFADGVGAIYDRLVPSRTESAWVYE